MQKEVSEALSSIRQSITVLESNIPQERHARSCIVQALQDLDQAVLFLEDIDRHRKKLERCAGFDEEFYP